MIALDTNLLVYSHREDSPWHDAAYRLIEELSEGRGPWVIPWPCIHEFLAIVTHPKIFNPPTPLDAALAQVEAWLQSPSLLLLSEIEGYWEVLKPALRVGRVGGPQIHDARVAAICQVHGIEELWSADRDFSRFPGVTFRNPLVG